MFVLHDPNQIAGMLESQLLVEVVQKIFFGELTGC